MPRMAMENVGRRLTNWQHSKWTTRSRTHNHSTNQLWTFWHGQTVGKTIGSAKQRRYAFLPLLCVSGRTVLVNRIRHTPGDLFVIIETLGTAITRPVQACTHLGIKIL